MKRKFLLILFILMFHKACFTQTGIPVWDSAIALEDEKKYIEAISAYEKALDFSDSSYRNAFIYSRMATCNEKLGKRDLQKEYLRLSIMIPAIAKRNVEKGMKRFWTGKLADLWFDDKKYDSALYYYYKLKKSLSPYFGLEDWYWDSQFYRMAMSHEKLGQVDSAIKCLTPHVFKQAPTYDDEEYSGIVRYYYKLLRKKYSGKQIKNEFEEAIKNLVYDTNIKNHGDTIKPSYSSHLDIILFFFGVRSFLSDGSAFGVPSDKISDLDIPGYSKAEIIEKLNKSVLRQIIYSKL